MPSTSGGYKSLVTQLRKDHLSGASELSRKASSVFVAFFSRCIRTEQIEAKNSKDYMDKLSILCQDLIGSKPDVVPIFNLSNSIITSLKKEKSGSVQCLRQLTKIKALKFFRNSFTSLERIGNNGQEWIKDNSTVLTLSFSGSVLSIFKKARQKKKNFRVMVCESRPLLEGRKLASVLSSWGISVTLMVDAAIGLLVDEADLILVGADGVTEEYFVNKIGSYPLCLCAKEKSLPVYLAYEESKFIPERFRIKLNHIRESGSIREVYKSIPGKVKIENPYFEKIPISLCKKIITEKVILIPSEVKEFLRRIKISRMLQDIGKV